MNQNLRFPLAALAAAAFCIGFATGLDWRVMLALKLAPTNSSPDWSPSCWRTWPMWLVI